MIYRCSSESDYKLAIEIVKAYGEWLNVDLSFQNYDAEIENFPEIYGGERGRFFIAKDNAVVIGGIGLRELEPEIGEVKRLFVMSQYARRGIGRKLLKSVISEASELGYRHLRLDSLPSMGPAMRLYREFGFREIPAYRDNPIVGTRYFELTVEV